MSQFFKQWNWGKGITVAIIAMCCGIVFMVYKATTYKYDMVVDNYYEEELNFNDEVVAIKNAQSLSYSIKIEQEGEFLLLEFPPECASKSVEGKLHLYRASDASKDLVMPIKFVSGSVVSIPKKNTITGNYNLIAEWIMDGKEYKIVKDFKVL